MISKSNRVICGNSEEKLKKLSSNSVNLCYLDPPFFANRIFEAKGKRGKIHSFDDTWGGDFDSYLECMKSVLQECHRVLKKTGSLYLHCDWHASHYLKIECDRIFGRKNFRNEIIWRRHNSHNDTKQGCKLFGRVHDVILFFTKSDDYVWNPMYEPYPKEFVEKYYKHVEEETGRKYALGDLSGPGGRSKGNPRYKFMGITRYWRYNEKKMKQLKKEGRIIQRRKGTVPVQKRYLDEMPGFDVARHLGRCKKCPSFKKRISGLPDSKTREITS